MRTRIRSLTRAFTLIEIMVVVVIIGLLIALAGPRIWNQFIVGQVGIARAKCKEYHDQVNLYKALTKKMPNSLEELTEPPQRGTDALVDTIEQDPWGNEYSLEIQGNKAYVRSFGKDGLEGTEDDIVWPEEER